MKVSTIAELDDGSKEIIVIEAIETLKKISIRHDRARYEGDGNPGCYARCQACMLEETIDALRKLVQ